MNIQHHFDLTALNTFALPARARYFIELTEAADLPLICQLPEFQRNNVLWLGGGSNILLRGDYHGLVVKMANRGIHELHRANGKVWLQAQAGEIWHDFVLHTLNLGLNGLENLSLIPGTVGAAPVQNIGAYGVEVKDLIDSVQCFDLDNQCFITLSNAECAFAYRESLFKQAGKGRYVITAVTFILSETFVMQTHYGDLATVLAANCPQRAITAIDVSHAVCQIRTAKLPNPKVLGNVGSFFKNPVVSVKLVQSLLTKYPNMPHYPQPDGTIKLAAGWLIDQCGLKGHRIGHAAVHDKQALVLVNLGGASAAEVAELATLIQHTVQQHFGVTLNPEPNWL